MTSSNLSSLNVYHASLALDRLEVAFAPAAADDDDEAAAADENDEAPPPAPLALLPPLTIFLVQYNPVDTKDGVQREVNDDDAEKEMIYGVETMDWWHGTSITYSG